MSVENFRPRCESCEHYEFRGVFSLAPRCAAKNIDNPTLCDEFVFSDHFLLKNAVAVTAIVRREVMGE